MRKPKILFYDIETKPVRFWGWRTGKQVVRHDQICNGEKFDIITIAWKWLGEKKVHCLDWGKAQDSGPMLEAFVKELEAADVVIGQNNNSFDDKQLNMQRMLHKQKPISWPTSEDMQIQVKKHFYVTSSSLEYLSKLLTGSGKDRMNFGDWLDIIEKKCPKALEKMKRYNKKDVLKTEAVWRRIQPYITPKASRALIGGGAKRDCPSCGSADIMKNGFRYTAAGRRQRCSCRACGHPFTTLVSS